MMNKKATTIIFGLIVFLFLILFCLFFLAIVYSSIESGNKLQESMKININYLKCCNGQQCSDTYYSELDNMCHLTMCENIPFGINKSQCIYAPNK